MDEGIAHTFHVQALANEQLMVAWLVEKRRQPGFVPDAGMLLSKAQVRSSGDHYHSR